MKSLDKEGAAHQQVAAPKSPVALKGSLETPDPTPLAPTDLWLRGRWLQDAKPEYVSRLACASGLPMVYEANGATFFFEGQGRWRLKGDKLTETITKVFDGTGSEEMQQEIGRPYTSQIKRVGPNEGAIWVDGEWLPMLRCPPVDDE